MGHGTSARRDRPDTASEEVGGKGQHSQNLSHTAMAFFTRRMHHRRSPLRHFVVLLEPPRQPQARYIGFGGVSSQSSRLRRSDGRGSLDGETGPSLARVVCGLKRSPREGSCGGNQAGAGESERERAGHLTGFAVGLERTEKRDNDGGEPERLEGTMAVLLHVTPWGAKILPSGYYLLPLMSMWRLMPGRTFF